MRVSPKFIEKNINQHWNKFSFINKNVIKNKDKIWKFTQITTGKLLYEEGKYMHNCCFSYIDRCINGDCAIFSLRCYDKEIVIDKKSATIEITENKKLIQARGRFNKELDKETVDIIDQWKDENGILNIDEHDVNYEGGRSLDNYYQYNIEYDNYNENDDKVEEN